jgi:hypothetical protein
MQPAYCGPYFRPIAKPSRPQHYVLPGSERLDPPYSWWSSPTWPFPRAPLAYESETRACGTGLIWGPTNSEACRPCPPPCPPKRCPPRCCCRPKHWWGCYFPKRICCC